MPLFKYDIVYFCYDDPKIQKDLANWTFPSDLASSVYTEIVYKSELVGLNGDVLIHETLHAMNRLLMFRKVYIIDTLDSGTPNEQVANLYKPLFPTMLRPYSLLTKIARIKEEIAYFKALLAQKKTDELSQMILRIADEEGVDGKVLLATIKAESGLNPNATNTNTDGSTDKGLCQYNDRVYPPIIYDEVVKDSEMSVRIMARRFKKGFMSDWSAWKNKSYLKYM